MVKGNSKSSATSATRKKHARKAVAINQADDPPVSSGKKPKGKEKRKEPRQKMYIPPIKPGPPQPDPLDSTGLSHSLPAELVIVLRGLGKKAEITKSRALEELQSSWVDKCNGQNDDFLIRCLTEMLPVWLHYIPSLFLHSSRRIRLGTATLHASLLQIEPVRGQMLSFLREKASRTQIESILGTWCIIAHDVDRMVCNVALQSWHRAVDDPTQSLRLEGEILSTLVTFIEKVALDPMGTYLSLNPPIPVAPHSPASKKTAGSRQILAPERKEAHQEPRSRVDETEENEDDKHARLRCGAIGTVRWLLATNSDSIKDILPLLSNPALWSSLCSAEDCPFVSLTSFGYAQPALRKSAWLLLQATLQLPKEHVHTLLPTLASAVLRSAWVETDTNVLSAMWKPLLAFLRGYPSCWELGYSKYPSACDPGDSSESEEASGHEPEVLEGSHKGIAHCSSPNYDAFLTFLESACAGCPTQGYPAVLVILSTIPLTILAEPAPPFSKFFTAMWSALNNQSFTSLRRSTVFTAFLTSLVECTVFLTKQLSIEKNAGVVSSVENPDAAAKTIIVDQIKQIWDNLCNKSLGVDEKISATLLGNMLISLLDIQEGFFSAAWTTVAQAVKDSRYSSSLLVPILLNSLHVRFSDRIALATPLVSLAKDIMGQTAVDVLQDLSDARLGPRTDEGLTFLVDMLNAFYKEVFNDPEAAEVIDQLMFDCHLHLLEQSALLIQTYLSTRKDKEKCSRLWQMLLSAVLSQPQKNLALMVPILDAAKSGLLPNLRSERGEFDGLILQCIINATSGRPTDIDVSLLEKLLRVADYCLSRQGLVSAFQTLFRTFNDAVESMLHEGTPMADMNVLLRLFGVVLEDVPDGPCLEEFDMAVVNVFTVGYLLSGCPSNEHPLTSQSARRLWEQWLQHSSTNRQTLVVAKLKRYLTALIRTTGTRVMPEYVVKVAHEHALELLIDAISSLLPSSQECDEMLTHLSPAAIHPSLAVIDPLILPDVGAEAGEPECDARGYNSYARVVYTLISVLSDNRREAKNYIWALKHILNFMVYASDYQSYPVGRSALFTSEALDTLGDVVTKARHLTTYLLTLDFKDSWRQKCLDVVMKDATLDDPGNPMSTFLLNILEDAKENDTSLATRVLKTVLQHILHDIDKDEAERWLMLAKQLEHEAPQTCIVITSAIIEIAPEPMSLDRYRNELAASLLSIPASQANVRGLLALQKLASTSPRPETDVIFLPQHRAVNVVKACQQWVLSDENIDEEVESVMMLVIVSLAPILQSVPGAHWEFIFDIVENSLENSDIDDDLTLVKLGRAMRLINEIQVLAKTNKGFSSSWGERKFHTLTLVRDMAMTKLDPGRISVPRTLCQEFMLTIMQDLPAGLMDADFLPKMCHLLTESSIHVQKMAYPLLNIAAKKRTETLVIEASVDAESALRIDLPDELIALVQFKLDAADSDALRQDESMLGYLLGWMLLLNSFQDASLKVRAGYMDQLRNLDLIAREFIPGILSLLQLEEGLGRAFKLDVWSVDEHYIEFFDPEVEISIPLLAAHLYYRALLTVPSLIHSWVLGCKDRGVLSTVTSYTSMHFSPVLIRAELAQVKSVETTSDLVDENFKIKVTSSTNEVTAAYAVDEHELEIKLKIPADWPLHKIEVKDVKRVGVEEHRWRAWVLAVQQSIWSHNGKVVDGLGLFKKNVTLHFDGQTECAICYSIISPMDGSLPKKPCKTCRNRFHAGCLYKWFNTSHSSSCPLCRSDII